MILGRRKSIYFPFRVLSPSTAQAGWLWRARHDAVYAVKALREGGPLWTTDVCVPISRLAECVTETQKDLRRTSPPPFYWHRSSAMPATVIFTLASWLIRVNRERWRRLNGSTNECSTGAIARRHLHRRARYRLRQDRLPERRAWRSGERDARNQDGDRSR
jgi:FAD/FMN-containing dehydrogenase